MKAMLIKDWKLMKGQKQFGLILCVFLAVFVVINDNLGFLISYMTLMASIFSISTVSYDEYNNGMVYLLALPISRRKYVEEKYLFCLLTSLIVSAVSLIVTLGIGIVRSTNATSEDLVISAAAALGMGALICGFMLPIQLKFGPEKSRIAMAVLGAAIFAIVYVMVWIGKRMGTDMENVLQNFNNLSRRGGSGRCSRDMSGSTANINIYLCSCDGKTRILDMFDLTMYNERGSWSGYSFLFRCYSVTFNNQSHSSIKESLIFFNWQWLLIQNRVVSGRTGKLNNGKEHNIYVVITVIILFHQFYKFVINLAVIGLSGEESITQSTHNQILRYEVHKWADPLPMY